MSSPYPPTIFIIIMIITPRRAHRALKYWASLWVPVDVVFVARFPNQIVGFSTKSSYNQRWRRKRENIKTKTTGLISKTKQSTCEVHFLADSSAIIARLTLSNWSEWQCDRYIVAFIGSISSRLRFYLKYRQSGSIFPVAKIIIFKSKHFAILLATFSFLSFQVIKQSVLSTGR